MVHRKFACHPSAGLNSLFVFFGMQKDLAPKFGVSFA
jgi:hypothetical protein